MRRDLEWDGCRNVRDLGGLPTAAGGVTAFGRVVRSDNPSRLTAAGWHAMRDYGIRTVMALRTIGTTDTEPEPAMIPPSITVERVELEDLTDAEFRRRCSDTDLWATPLQWAEMLRFWPDRCAASVAAVAHADGGGIVVSCGLGRDRTGLVSFLLLALVGVPADAIGRDWSHSLLRLAGDPQAAGPSPTEIMARHGVTVSEAVETALALDVASKLREGGLGAADVATVRQRLVG